MDQHPKAPPGFSPDRVNPPPAAAEPAPRDVVAAIALDGRISLTPEARDQLSMEIAERSRQIARALGVSEAMPWKDLVEHVQLLEDMRRALDDAFRMRDEQLGAALGYGGKELSGRTWDSLLADVRNLAEERDQLKARVERGEQFWDRSIDLCDVLNVDRTTSWDDLIRTVVALKNAARESWAQLAEIKAELVATRGKVEVQPKITPRPSQVQQQVRRLEIAVDDAEAVRLGDDQLTALGERLDAMSRDLATHMYYSKVDPQVLEARLADVEARIGQPGPLDALEARLDALAETHERWKGTVDALSERVTELHKHHENNAMESQRRDAALTERFAVSDERRTAIVGRLQALEAFQATLTDRIAATEAWQRGATERLGDPTQPMPDPWSKVPVAETNRARPGEGQFVPPSDLLIGDWVVFDGVPREVTGLSPEEVVVGPDVGAVSIDRSGHALRLVWRPNRKERRRG